MRYLIAENCAALIFIVAPFSSQFATASSVCDTHFFDRENLQKIAQSGQVDTLSQILQLAPDCYKSNQVAVYKSHSLHCANSKAPRIIL